MSQLHRMAPKDSAACTSNDLGYAACLASRGGSRIKACRSGLHALTCVSRQRQTWRPHCKSLHRLACRSLRMRCSPCAPTVAGRTSRPHSASTRRSAVPSQRSSREPCTRQQRPTRALAPCALACCADEQPCALHVLVLLGTLAMCEMTTRRAVTARVAGSLMSLSRALMTERTLPRWPQAQTNQLTSLLQTLLSRRPRGRPRLVGP